MGIKIIRALVTNKLISKGRLGNPETLPQEGGSFGGENGLSSRKGGGCARIHLGAEQPVLGASIKQRKIEVLPRAVSAATDND